MTDSQFEEAVNDVLDALKDISETLREIKAEIRLS